MLQKILILFKLSYPKFWRKENNFFERIYIFFLMPFSFIYFLIYLINKKIKKNKKVGIPVICVGNLTAGGSGKTSFVIYLINFLKKKKINVHVVSRGYLGKLRGPVKVNIKKHTLKDVGDEALLIAEKTTVWVSKNKYEGALAATLHGADIILLDDGIQNYSLYKDLNIIVVDGNFGFGNRFLLPAGPLRETVNSGIKKADILIMFNKDKNNEEEKIKNKIQVIHSTFQIKNYTKLKKKKIVAFAGLGRPEKFLESLLEKKINISKFVPFPDHYLYKRNEINKLINFADKNNSILVTTLKDKQRINLDQRKKIYYVDLEIKVKEKNLLTKFLKKKNCIN